MPFTPTHILAVLPIRLAFKKLSLSNLAIGSIIPDFALFYPVIPYEFSHSLVGVFACCLPVGIIVCFLFELTGKTLIVDLSPTWVKYRINNYRDIQTEYTAGRMIMLSVAIVIGSITHIVWDAFTHKGEWGVKLIPLLDTEIEIASIILPGYKLFQYGSTIIGLPFLGVLVFLYLKNRQPMIDSRIFHLTKSLFWTIIGSFLIIPIAIAMYHFQQSESFISILGNTIKQSISAEITIFFIYATAYKIYLSR